MSNTKVNYPDPEELEEFYRSMFRLSSEGALNLSENLRDDEYMRELHGGDVDRVCDLLTLLTGAEAGRRPLQFQRGGRIPIRISSSRCCLSPYHDVW